MIPKCVSKKELNCWLLLFWRFSEKKRIYSNLRYSIRSTQHDCISVFSLQRQCLKGCPMFLSNSQPLARQPVQSNFIIFFSQQEWKIKQLVDFFLCVLETSCWDDRSGKSLHWDHSNPHPSHCFPLSSQTASQGQSIVGGLALQPGPFLISFQVAPVNEIQTQVRAESKLLLMTQLTLVLPSKFSALFCSKFQAFPIKYLHLG